MKRIALCLMLLAAPAMAEDAPVETVNAYGASLVGVWHGTLVQSRFVGLLNAVTGFSPPSFGEMAKAYCRVAPMGNELEMSCVQFGSNGRVTMQDGHVRIGGVGNVGFEGEQPDADSLRGHFYSRSWLGMSRQNSATAEAVRLVPQADAPDRAGKAPLLRRILDQGLAGVPQDAGAMKKNDSILTLPKLGAVQAIAYLGQETKWDWPPPPGVKPDPMHIPSRPDFFSVYFVRFTDGERLCGLHQRDDGVLDAFRCT